MNKLKIQSRIKIIAAILVALAVTTTVSPRLFVADSPQINTQFIADIRNIPSDFVAFLMNKPTEDTASALADLKQQQVENVPEGLTFAPIAKGVEAAEDPATGKTYTKIEAGTELEVFTVTLDDGREVKVYVPVQ